MWEIMTYMTCTTTRLPPFGKGIFSMYRTLFEWVLPELNILKKVRTDGIYCQLQHAFGLCPRGEKEVVVD